MASDRLQTLAAIDPAKLTEIVRKAEASARFEIGAWQVRLLTSQGAINPQGLFIISGDGQDENGSRQWSVVLKWIQAGDAPLAPDHIWHWKREYSAMEFGLANRLPGPLAAPRCYGVEEVPGGAWFWLEHIVDASPRRWGSAEYAFAAEQLGRTTGAYLVNGPVLDEPWLGHSHARIWAEGSPPTDEIWANAHIQTAWPSALRGRVQALWDQREQLSAALDHLPRTLGHFDSQRRNLMIRPRQTGEPELVAVDWAWCGWGPVGGDAAELIGNSMILFEYDPRAAAALDEVVFSAYLKGLRLERWAGEVDSVRLAYTASIALFCALSAPAFTVMSTRPELQDWVTEHSGLDMAGAVSHYAALAAFAVERGEEALRLIKHLGEISSTN